MRRFMLASRQFLPPPRRRLRLLLRYAPAFPGPELIGMRRCRFDRFAAGSAPDGLEKVQRGAGGVTRLLDHRHVTALRKHNCPCVRHQRFVEASLAAVQQAIGITPHDQRRHIH